MPDASDFSLLILAIIQGATEFLPVSSSGHLALGQAILGVGQGSVFDDVLLHLGTLGAVIVFYRRDLMRLARDGVRSGSDGSQARAYIGHLVIGTIPAVIVGFTLKSSIEALFDRVGAVLVFLSLTGVALMATRWLPRRDRGLNGWRALLIGCAQALAILPGMSRSGWTIVVALCFGLKPAEAARFSFLLSIPAIVGAAVLQLADGAPRESAPGWLLLSVSLAFLVGLLCLRWLVRLVSNMALHRFAWYLWVLALLGAVALRRGAL